MTFLTTRLRLPKPLSPNEHTRLSQLSTVYGIRGLSIEGEELVIEYDASRIREAEVLAAVRKVGINVTPPKAIPLGGLDHTGEFKDFAWPTRGITPVNEKAG